MGGGARSKQVFFTNQGGAPPPAVSRKAFSHGFDLGWLVLICVFLVLISVSCSVSDSVGGSFD